MLRGAAAGRTGRIVALKLDELLRAVHGARTALVKLDQMSDEELKVIQEEFQRLKVRYAPLVDDDLAHVDQEIASGKGRS